MYDKETGIWDASIVHRHKCDYFLALGILTYIVIPRTMADLGCGTGLYCRFFEQMGCQDVTGYEGTPDMRNYGIFKNICTVDLSQEIFCSPMAEPYELVLCLEVGEHIPEAFEDIFLDNVANHANDMVIMSWAVPGQGGKGHINERTNEWVIDEMEKRGCTYDAGSTNYLRANTSNCYWFKNTLMVFMRSNER